MKNKNSSETIYKELLRKLIHLLGLPVLIIYSFTRFNYGQKPAILFLTVLLIILLEVEHIRLEYKLKLPEQIDVLRKHEKRNLSGSIFFIISTIICFAAFEYQIALLALSMTVFGDLASALAGRFFGKTIIYKNKSLQGSLAGLLTNLITGYLIIPNHPEIFIPMALIAVLVELFTGKLDDNLTVPLASGFTGQIIFYFIILPALPHLVL